MDEHYKGTSGVVWVHGIQAGQEQSIIALDPVTATEALRMATQAFGFLSGMYQNDAMAQDSRVQFFVMIVFELLGTSLPTINFLHCYRNCASDIAENTKDMVHETAVSAVGKRSYLRRNSRAPRRSKACSLSITCEGFDSSKGDTLFCLRPDKDAVARSPGTGV